MTIESNKRISSMQYIAKERSKWINETRTKASQFMQKVSQITTVLNNGISIPLSSPNFGSPRNYRAFTERLDEAYSILKSTEISYYELRLSFNPNDSAMRDKKILKIIEEIFIIVKRIEVDIMEMTKIIVNDYTFNYTGKNRTINNEEFFIEINEKLYDFFKMIFKKTEEFDNRNGELENELKFYFKEEWEKAKEESQARNKKTKKLVASIGVEED